MAKKVPKTLLLRLGLVVYLVFVSVTTLSRAASVSFNYNFSTPGALTNPDLKYLSNATAAGDRIDLTKDTLWSTGRVAYGLPVQLWDNTGKVASFTSNFTFVIKPQINTSGQGDGMAFFVGTYPPSLPNDSSGGLLGLVNGLGKTGFPPIVAVEFDAFRNEWDPKNVTKHIGVDVNSITSAATTTLPDWCFNGTTMSAWVRYDADAGMLSATLRLDDRQPGLLSLYNVSAPVDFRAEGLPQLGVVGFSAATGDLFERHQILSWSFESTLSNVPANKSVSKASKTTNISLIAGLASAGTVILLIVAAWLLYLEYQKRIGGKQGQKKDAPVDGDMDDVFNKGTGPRRFTYRQLSKATRGFSDDWKLGEGGFGSVYRGFLQDQGLHVAIKRVSKTSKQGKREYVSEVTIISRLRHRNLVQLLGWCHEGNELLLVYELMTNGSLDAHLYSTSNVLTWPIRYNIILGMGSALLYLHQEWEQCVVHRDIKPSNVMLDASFTAKLGDFGLARLVDHARATHTTMVAGTRGYIDPECAVTFHATASSDVYSFGIVLLEVACGRKPVAPEEEDEGRVLLVRWVWELYGRGEILAAADARLLHGELHEAELEHALIVGLWCAHPDSAARPSIRQAMGVLQFEAPMPELPLEMPVATYGPPGGSGGSYWSSNNASSCGRSGSSRGRASISEQTTTHSSSACKINYNMGSAALSPVDPTDE
ncbi:unnamed protein product [Urochloa humidicola]